LVFSSRAAAAHLRSGPRGERFGRVSDLFGSATYLLFGRVDALHIFINSFKMVTTTNDAINRIEADAALVAGLSDARFRP